MFGSSLDRVKPDRRNCPNYAFTTADVLPITQPAPIGDRCIDTRKSRPAGGTRRMLKLSRRPEVTAHEAVGPGGSL